MKKLIVLLSLSLAISSCTPYIYLKHELVEGDLENQMDKVQLFIDRDISIERVVTSKEAGLSQKGTYSTRQGIMYYTIKFDAKLPGLVGSGSTEEKIIVILDEKASECLPFKNFGDDEFYHLVGEKKSGKFTVTYDGHEYEVSQGHEAKLMMKRADNKKIKKKVHKAKGRRL
ncbi:MAG: hypothetical protein LBT61_04400 [Prevotellaceae bacterium]|jgi:hypothetical protein|nr:hypothetical protein [Prevotellaceae bacterium]